MTTVMPDSFGYVSGTTMSAATAAGAVAFARTVNPDASGLQLRSSILETGVVLPSLSGKVLNGKSLDTTDFFDVVLALPQPVRTPLVFYPN